MSDGSHASAELDEAEAIEHGGPVIKMLKETGHKVSYSWGTNCKWVECNVDGLLFDLDLQPNGWRLRLRDAPTWSGGHFVQSAVGWIESQLMSYQQVVQSEKEKFTEACAETFFEKTGLKFDTDKPKWSLFPSGVLAKVLDVLMFGAKKYDEDNWKKVDNQRVRYYNAMMRHIEAWWTGEKADKETGIHHLAHAICCAMFLLWGDENGTI